MELKKPSLIEPVKTPGLHFRHFTQALGPPQWVIGSSVGVDIKTLFPKVTQFLVLRLL